MVINSPYEVPISLRSRRCGQSGTGRDSVAVRLAACVWSKEKNKSRRTEKEGTISLEQPTSRITTFRPSSDSGAYPLPEPWTLPGNGCPPPVRTTDTLLFCTSIELSETEGRKVWRRKPECEKPEISGREASRPRFGPIRTETPTAFSSPYADESVFTTCPTQGLALGLNHCTSSPCWAVDHVHH